jgi:nucleoside 2-deoxyribosyltransferase
MLKRIDNCDVVYIVSCGGYIGKTVAMEIGYAIAKKKKIMAMEKITEAGLNHFIATVLPPKKLIERLRN